MPSNSSTVPFPTSLSNMHPMWSVMPISVFVLNFMFRFSSILFVNIFISLRADFPSIFSRLFSRVSPILIYMVSASISSCMLLMALLFKISSRSNCFSSYQCRTDLLYIKFWSCIDLVSTGTGKMIKYMIEVISKLDHIYSDLRKEAGKC